MCLIAFALNSSSRYKLVLASNRDEFHDRPSLAAHWWDSYPQVYAGRDLEAGGTWLGVSRSGRVAAVTNFRDRPVRGSGSRSRGELGLRFLIDEACAAQHAKKLAEEADSYGGFNLLLFDWQDDHMPCLYLTNRDARAPLQAPSHGVHGLSNHLLNTPWPKVKRLRSALESALDLPNPMERLFDALADKSPVDVSEVGDAPGDPDALARTPFIANAHYGTRASTVITLEGNGRLTFCERSWLWRDGELCMNGERFVQFQVQT
jgi:uncharacterized protein with NRDE domain